MPHGEGQVRGGEWWRRGREGRWDVFEEATRHLATVLQEQKCKCSVSYPIVWFVKYMRREGRKGQERRVCVAVTMI